MTIELSTSATPNGWKITIMLEELKEAGVVLPEIIIHSINLSKGEQFSEQFVNINPNQKIPALKDGNIKLMESCAILQYLGEKYPSDLLPNDEKKWPVIQWLYWQAANLGPVFGNKLSYTRYMNDVDDIRKSHPLERFNGEAQRLLRVLNKQLEGQDFICGNRFTVADIASYPWVRGYKWSKIDITLHQNVVDWVARVRSRPGVERGISWGVPKDEIDKWSKERKAQYAKGGSSIASNESINKGISNHC